MTIIALLPKITKNNKIIKKKVQMIVFNKTNKMVKTKSKKQM